MSKRLLYAIKSILIVALMASVLSGCGSPKVSDTYPLESVNKDGAETSYVYRAEGKTVPVVATELKDQRKPKEISKEDPDHMFLVYSDEWIHVMKDEKKPEDSLIEVDSKAYVQRNYNPSFLEAYVIGSIVGNLFDSFGGKRYGDYRGYSSSDTYKPSKKYHAPTASEKKAIPPMTVDRTGSIFKRGSTSGTSKSDDGGLFSKKKSSGSITKNKGSTSGSFFSPSKSKVPRTKSGTGKIFKRSRR
ncbi:hypothetical protein BVG16_22920 [Paenibacillus selenitireducens]|uniref:DUF4247 domain-containing protein n=1 Tax=Paenibacillus selenitireducens TaxID=1324314 RepID=A0A1T2X421_9BACL|nr:DUF4247 domain-containing protein [Paenibacillus selenitireducens]OPA74619.1 hypothetical protein BVG16_22920 [Paenibacillus selenitireducens]